MSNAVLPISMAMFPGAIVSPRYSTKVQTAVSGRETRAAFMAYPLYDVTLVSDVLRTGALGAELETLSGFFRQMRGMWDSFLVAVPGDSVAASQAFGVGDGLKKIFQLTRTFGGGGFGFADPCQNIASLTSIEANGSVVSGSDYSIGSTGLVTFVTAPASDAVLTWSGSYYFRCRFTQDSADFEQFQINMWKLGKLTMTGAPGNKV
jgi:uncharacterized protein (TIGR02217 family)